MHSITKKSAQLATLHMQTTSADLEACLQSYNIHNLLIKQTLLGITHITLKKWAKLYFLNKEKCLLNYKNVKIWQDGVYVTFFRF